MKSRYEALVALVLLVAAGLLMRAVSHGEETPLRSALAEFPRQIGAWTGSEQTLDTKVLQVLKVDEYLLRQYAHEQDPPIGLYIGYYQSMRHGATYHSPKNCLPGSGWYFVSTDTALLRVTEPQGRPIEINKLIIQKGLDKQLVLYWYQDRGRIITSEYWAKVYMVLDAVTKHRTDGAFIRITVPFGQQAETDVLTRGTAFAEQLFPVLQEYLPR